MNGNVNILGENNSRSESDSNLLFYLKTRILNHLKISSFFNYQERFRYLTEKLSSCIGIMMVFLNYHHCQDKPLRFSHYQPNFYYRYHSHCLINCHGQRHLPYNFMHCTFCTLYFNGYMELQEYAKQKEVKHRRKIILPCVIPWEYGSNKYASQKGTGGFGTIRNATTTIKSSKQLSESNDGVVPWMNCPQLRDKELASQAGLTPFGGIREHVIKVQDKEGEKKKDINKIVGDQTSESILKIWSQANPEAKNDQLFGKHRDAIMEVKGGRQFSQKELDASRAAIPKFQDPRETAAAKAQKASITHCNGLVKNKQKETGNPRGNEDNVLDSSYMAWIGGQLTLQSESNPADLQNSHDVVSKSYFDRVMSEKEYVIGKAKKEKVQERREKTKLRSKFEFDGRERKIKETEIAK